MSGDLSTGLTNYTTQSQHLLHRLHKENKVKDTVQAIGNKKKCKSGKNVSMTRKQLTEK